MAIEQVTDPAANIFKPADTNSESAVAFEESKASSNLQSPARKRARKAPPIPTSLVRQEVSEGAGPHPSGPLASIFTRTINKEVEIESIDSDHFNKNPHGNIPMLEMDKLAVNETYA